MTISPWSPRSADADSASLLDRYLQHLAQQGKSAAVQRLAAELLLRKEDSGGGQPEKISNPK
jgi:hypothetical protein